MLLTCPFCRQISFDRSYTDRSSVDFAQMHSGTSWCPSPITCCAHAATLTIVSELPTQTLQSFLKEMKFSRRRRVLVEVAVCQFWSRHRCEIYDDPPCLPLQQNFPYLLQFLSSSRLKILVTEVTGPCQSPQDSLRASRHPSWEQAPERQCSSASGGVHESFPGQPFRKWSVSTH